MYIKKVRLKNLADREREIRIFFHHDFNILESPAANTAYYDPDEKAIIHYKEKRYFLMSGMRNNVQGIDQYATGIKDFHGLEGTWRDAEDGKLEGNPIAQGSIDSTLSFTVKVPAQGGTDDILLDLRRGRLWRRKPSEQDDQRARAGTFHEAHRKLLAGMDQ